MKTIWIRPRTTIDHVLNNRLDFVTYLIPFMYGFAWSAIANELGYDFNALGITISAMFGLLTTFVLLWVFAPVTTLVSRLLGMHTSLSDMQIALSWIHIPFAVFSIAWLAFTVFAQRFGIGYWDFEDLDTLTTMQDMTQSGLALLWVLFAAIAVSAALRTTFPRGLLCTLLSLAIVTIPLWSFGWPESPLEF